MDNVNVLSLLRERGFIKQTVFEDRLVEHLNSGVTFYAGFDPTADSLHIGHYIPVMAMAHLQRAGHRPIILIGGGTAMIGDPTNRSDMRSMMDSATIKANCEAFRKQLSRFLSFSGDNAAIIVDNADWITKLNYIEFLREYGALFSVNKMLTAECFKTRLERGLSFLEFNYMLMQAYDFLKLFENYGCTLQIGGNDQWSNMLAGADLIRRKQGAEAFVFTLALLENSSGAKMGKTSKGALWLDEKKTTPFEFYQYFRNIEDAKVGECLKLLTFLPCDEIERATSADINQAKELLGFEVARLIHGEAAADLARKQARAAFGGDESNMPRLDSELPLDAQVADLLCEAKLALSKSDARRLIGGGGIKIGERVVLDAFDKIDAYCTDKQFVLHKGKKNHILVVLK